MTGRVSDAGNGGHLPSAGRVRIRIHNDVGGVANRVRSNGLDSSLVSLYETAFWYFIFLPRHLTVKRGEREAGSGVDGLMCRATCSVKWPRRGPEEAPHSGPVKGSRCSRPAFRLASGWTGFFAATAVRWSGARDIGVHPHRDRTHESKDSNTEKQARATEVTEIRTMTPRVGTRPHTARSVPMLFYSVTSLALACFSVFKKPHLLSMFLVRRASKCAR